MEKRFLLWKESKKQEQPNGLEYLTMIWMDRVPNQKRIITHRIACDSNVPYTVKRRDIEAYAARTLNDAGFKMWLYMSANRMKEWLEK